MPKQKRWEIKRHCDQALSNINKAIDALVKAGFQFKGVHEDIYQQYCTVISVLDSTKPVITDLQNK